MMIYARRLSELTAKGSSTLDAIKARLLALPEVEAVYIKEFPRSFEAIVKGGLENAIAQCLWDAKPLGVEAVGNISGEALDLWGHSHNIYFSRPSIIEIKLETKILVNNNLSDNDINKIKNALANFAMKNFTLGSKVYSSQFYPVLLAHNLIVDVLQLTMKEKATNKTPSQEIKPEEIIYLPFNNIAIEWVS